MYMCNLIQSNEWLVSSSKHYSSNVGGCPLKFTYYFIEAIAVSCWWSLLLLLLLCNGKGTKVVVSILFSASRFFSFFPFICYVRSFTKENRQARKYNAMVEDDKIILIDSHCRCQRCRHCIVLHCTTSNYWRFSSIIFVQRQEISWRIKAFFSPFFFSSIVCFEMWRVNEWNVLAIAFFFTRQLLLLIS